MAVWHGGHGCGLHLPFRATSTCSRLSRPCSPHQAPTRRGCGSHVAATRDSERGVKRLGGPPTGSTADGHVPHVPTSCKSRLPLVHAVVHLHRHRSAHTKPITSTTFLVLPRAMPCACLPAMATTPCVKPPPYLYRRGLRLPASRQPLAHSSRQRHPPARRARLNRVEREKGAREKKHVFWRRVELYPTFGLHGDPKP